MWDGDWMKTSNLIAAALEIVELQHSGITVGYLLKEKICREHGIFLETMTKDEISKFDNLIKRLKDQRGLYLESI